MPRIIQVPANASAAAIQAVVAGTRAREIALSFPFGMPCVAGTSDAMRDLHARALALYKEVVILGGDEHLRAVAVAAGFPAATSVEEWEATLPQIPAIARWDDEDDDWQGPPPLALVPPHDDRSPYDDPFEPFNDLPPEFVLELMARDGAYGAPGADDDHDAGILLDGNAADEDELRAEHERYEERITRAIRHTGGLSLSSPSHPRLALSPTMQSGSTDGGDESSSV